MGIIKGAHAAMRAAHGLKLRVNGGVIPIDGGRLYVDHSDGRARRLSRLRGPVDQAAVKAWQRLVREVQPNVVIDIGANYGEVVFSTTYQPGTEIHLVEANPRLVPFLERTASHWGATVHAGAASDEPGVVTLRTASISSGLASVARSHGSHDGQTEVRAFRLDDELPDHLHGRAAIKIDVEGHEPAVIRGMERLLARFDPVAILCEINPQTLAELRQQFDVRAIRRDTSEFVALTGDLDRAVFTKDVVLTPR